MAKSWIESSSLSDTPQARVAGPGTFRASFASVFFPEILRWRSLEGLGSAEETDVVVEGAKPEMELRATGLLDPYA